MNEIFYSLQGEGARAGSANVFIRLSGCSAKHACFASGVACDTEFESGTEHGKEELFRKIVSLNKDCRNLIWTGGEPTDQLDEEWIAYFRNRSYFQAIETSGLRPAPSVDYVAVSPKVAEHVVAKNFTHVQELRYVRHEGQGIPEPQITADHYFISPHAGTEQTTKRNLQHCIELVQQHPQWRLSVQMHKFWDVL